LNNNGISYYVNREDGEQISAEISCKSGMEAAMKRVIPRMPLVIALAQVLIFAVIVGTLSAANFDAGIPVGSKIPTFEARDQKGMVQTFESIRGPKGAFLVFYRSADW
jgi:hypothetical protein